MAARKDCKTVYLNIFVSVFSAIAIILFAVLLPVSVQAATWDSTPYTHQQADGTIVTVRQLGDEFFHWYEDTGGNILAWNNETLSYYYAVIEGGRVVPGLYPAGSVLPAEFDLLEFEDILPIIISVDRNIFPRADILSGIDIDPMSQNLTFPIRTGFDLVTILIDFDGTPHPQIPLPLEGRATLPWGAANSSGIYTERQRAYFDRTPGAFSVVNFFEDMSGGQGIYTPLQTVGRVGSGTRRTIRTGSWIGHSLFQNRDIDVTVFPSLQDGVIRVRIHLAHPIERWEGDSDQTFFRSRAMTALAIHTIHTHYIPLNGRRPDGGQQIHFSICMAVNPGNVGGYQGQFSGAAIGFTGGNVLYGMYNSRHADEGSGTNLGIGVAVHELGHVLGLPDFYSYRSHPDYQSSTGLGWLCAMGMGAGQPPAPLSAWARVLLGYVVPEVICASEGGIANVRRWEQGNPNSFNVIRVNSPDCPHQFFLIENRQRNVGWDTTRIGTTTFMGGIAIFHVDPFAARAPANARYHIRDFQPLVRFPDGALRRISGPVDYTPHPQVRAVLANNALLPTSGGDHFFHSGASNRSRFSPTTTPNTNFYPIEWHTDGRRIANGNRNRNSGIDIQILDPRQPTMRIQVHGRSPVSAISLSTSGTHDFGNANVGYSQITAHSVTVTNTGNQATGALTIALSGSNDGSFTLSRTSIPSITASGGTQSFTIRPNNNLPPGIYNATVTVSGGSGLTPQSFNVRFAVRSWAISLTPAGNHIFPSADAGYAAPTAHSVTVRNTGTQPTGTLRIALSGANEENFTLNRISIPSLAANATETFTVRPNTELPAGNYETTVTVYPDPTVTTTARHTTAAGSTIATSGTASWENHDRVRDTALPSSSSPGTGNGWGTWGQTRTGGSAADSAFLHYRWAQPVLMNRAEIFWYDDGGGTRIPTATTWAIQHSNDGTNWQNVQLTGSTNYNNGRALNTLNSFIFDDVEARYLRIYIWGITASAAGTGVLRFHVFHDSHPQNIAPQSFNVSFTVTDSNPHIPVTSINKTSSLTGTAGTPIALAGTALPGNATNQTIVWSLGIGSTASDAAVNVAGQATATGAGTVNVAATVVGGGADGANFTQNFTINFATRTLNFTPSQIEITNADPTQVVTFSNYGSGMTEMVYTIPSELAGLITISRNQLEITVAATPPQTGFVSGEFIVTVNRGPGPEATGFFTVNVNLIAETSPPCLVCDRYPCECPEYCPVCERYPCECPELCWVCERYPCECPELCPVCDRYPCECPELCPVCERYPCECPELCPVCDRYPCECGDTYTVIFNFNGGTHNGTDLYPVEYEVEHNTAIGGTLLSVRRPGHRFVGWFDTSEPTGGTRIHADTPITNNSNLYARWVETATLNDFRLGDADGDGRITSADANVIAHLVLEYGTIVLNENSHQSLLAADLNGDGYITIADITLLARWLVGHDVSPLIAH